MLEFHNLPKVQRLKTAPHSLPGKYWWPREMVADAGEKSSQFSAGAGVAGWRWRDFGTLEAAANSQSRTRERRAARDQVGQDLNFLGWYLLKDYTWRMLFNIIWQRFNCNTMYWVDRKQTFTPTFNLSRNPAINISHRSWKQFLLNKNKQRFCFSQVSWFDVRIPNMSILKSGP